MAKIRGALSLRHPVSIPPENPIAKCLTFLHTARKARIDLRSRGLVAAP
jgi:hypothetical protein